jgi:hypothetical protein
VSAVDVAGLADVFEPIALDQLDARASLQTRNDNKYLVTRDEFAAFLDELGDAYLALEIDGRRCFTYDSVYFDAEGLVAYRAHVQRRRRRFKVRTRRYVDSGLCALEVKLKGGRGETIKHKLAWDEALHGILAIPGREFLDHTLREAYGLELDEAFAPALQTSYRRLTLVHRERDERVTCDLGLAVAGERLAGRMRPELVLVESKSERGRGIADMALRGVGARPVKVSKYCLGIALTRPEVTSNDFRRTLARAFEPPGPSGRWGLAGAPQAMAA